MNKRQVKKLEQRKLYFSFENGPSRLLRILKWREVKQLKKVLAK